MLSPIEVVSLGQSLTQSALAFWSAGGCQERLWGTGISVTEGFLRLNNASRCGAANPKNLFFSNSPVSPGAHLLTKKPEDSGYEIVPRPISYPESSGSLASGLSLLAKEPEYSGYEIGPRPVVIIVVE